MEQADRSNIQYLSNIQACLGWFRVKNDAFNQPQNIKHYKVYNDIFSSEVSSVKVSLLHFQLTLLSSIFSKNVLISSTLPRQPVQTACFTSPSAQHYWARNGHGQVCVFFRAV